MYASETPLEFVSEDALKLLFYDGDAPTFEHGRRSSNLLAADLYDARLIAKLCLYDPASGKMAVERLPSLWDASTRRIDARQVERARSAQWHRELDEMARLAQT